MVGRFFGRSVGRSALISRADRIDALPVLIFLDFPAWPEQYAALQNTGLVARSGRF